MKSYFKSKEFWITILIMILILIANLIPSLQNTFYIGLFRDCFSYWYCNIFYGYGEYLTVIIVLLFSFCSINSFYYKVTGSYLKDSTIREKYSSFLKKELLKTYVKSVLPLFIISTLIFVIGRIQYSPVILPYNAHYNTMSMEGLITNPYIYVIMTYFTWFIFAAACINITVIFIYFIKKLWISIISSYIFTTLFNFLCQFIVQTIGYMIGGSALQAKMGFFNLISGFKVDPNILVSFSIAFGFFILSLIGVLIIYRDKERVILNYE